MVAAFSFFGGIRKVIYTAGKELKIKKG